MTHRALEAALLAFAVTCLVAVTGGSALAQDAPPPGAPPRCGGLICDLGIIGGSPAAAAAGLPDKTALPCNDFLCRAFGGGRSAQAAPPPPVATEPEPEKSAKKRHKRVSSAEIKSLPGTKRALESKNAPESK